MKCGIIRPVLRTNADTFFAFPDLAAIKQANDELEPGRLVPQRRPRRCWRRGRGSWRSISGSTPRRRRSSRCSGRSRRARRSTADAPAPRDTALAEEYFRAASALDDGDEAKQDQAAAAYRKALEIDPYLVAALINLANIHYSRDELAEAQALYERAIGLESDFFEAHFNLGNIYHDLGRFAEAQALLQGSAPPQPLLRRHALLSRGDLEKMGLSQEARAALARLSAARAEGRVGRAGEGVLRVAHWAGDTASCLGWPSRSAAAGRQRRRLTPPSRPRPRPDSRPSAIAGDRFTVDGSPAVPGLHFVLRRHAARAAAGGVDADFSYLEGKVHGVRVFPNWWGDPCTLRSGADTLIDVDGGIRPEAWRQLQAVLDRAAAHRLVVDLSLTRETVTDNGSPARVLSASTRTPRRSPRLVGSDGLPEGEVSARADRRAERMAAVRGRRRTMEALLGRLRAADPQRILAASSSGGPYQPVGLSVPNMAAAYHDPREQRLVHRGGRDAGRHRREVSARRRGAAGLSPGARLRPARSARAQQITTPDAVALSRRDAARPGGRSRGVDVSHPARLRAARADADAAASGRRRMRPRKPCRSVAEHDHESGADKPDSAGRSTEIKTAKADRPRPPNC